MKVTQNNSPIKMDAYIKQIQLQHQQKDVQQSTNAQKGTVDKVQLSDQAKQIQQRSFSHGQAGDIRDEKVRQVKLDIEKGTYNVNPAKVATDMLREAFENNKVLKSIDTRA